MIDPATIAAIASAVVTIIFTKAIEKGGENLGEIAFSKMSELLNLIKDKFQKEGVEGKLLNAQREPSEENTERFKEELAYLMKNDQIFAQKLQSIIDELKSDLQVDQILLKDIKSVGDAEISNVEQIRKGDSPAQQQALTDIETGGKLKISNVKQQSLSDETKRKRFWFF